MNTIVCNSKEVKLIPVNKQLKCHICPDCYSGVVRLGPMWVCSDADNCAGVVFKKIYKWIKKRRILHLGESTLRLLVDDGAVKSVPDLYFLTAAKMVAAGVGAGDAARILPQIEKSKTCSLAELIGSLSLDKVGRTEASNLIALGIDTLGEWKLVTAAQIEAFSGYHGGVKANAIATAVQDNWQMIEAVACHLNNGNQPPVSTKPVVKASSDKSFVVCLTGSMSRPRQEIAADIENAGHHVEDKVRANVTHLCQADPSSQSSKSKKAIKLGIPIISETQLLAML